jgi:hypothetical protein
VKTPPLPTTLAAALLAGLATLAGGGCKRAEKKPAPGSSALAALAAPQAAATPLRVARTHETFKLDGELDEPPWNAIAARTGAFLDDTGSSARPYSEARFLWDADNLYVGLYAADEDIRATVTEHDGPVWIDDAFALHLSPGPAAGDGGPATVYAFDISATGVVTDARKVAGGKSDVSWESGIKLGVDRDGTVNNPKDFDEEWVVEAAIPFRSLGIEPRPGARVLVDIGRCDTPRGSKERRCGAWGTPKAPRVIELSP